MTAAAEVIRRLAAWRLTLATAESCTGGLLGAALTDVPGSSAVYRGGIISYATEIKHQVLGVPAQVLDTLGPVSQPVAEAMALGACRVLGARVALSTAGLAGPGGDSFGNPVGRVWIACAWDGHVRARCCHFPGARQQVRQAAVEQALAMILTWEVEQP